MKYRAFLPALTLLLLTACGKAELTGISLQPVTVQAGETAEVAVQYETSGKASDTAIQTAVDANHWTWQTGDENIATVNSQGVVTGLHGGETTLTLTDASDDPDRHMQWQDGHRHGHCGAHPGGDSSKH